MKLLLLLLVPLVSLVVAWDEDFENCPEPEHRERRGMQHVDNFVKHHENRRSASLRKQRHRKLDDDYSFVLKMHWFLGACWQHEYERHRRWCLECEYQNEDGPECQRGDKLVIDTCGTSDRQRFIWESVDGGGGGKLKPQGSPDLCFTEDYIFDPEDHERDIRWIKFRLDNCEDDNDDQVFFGFDPDDPFELTPKSDDSYVLSQDHDPMWNEEIMGIKRSTARGDHTSLWEVIEEEGDYEGPNPSPPAPEPTEAPPECDPYKTGLKSDPSSPHIIQSSDDPFEHGDVMLEQRNDGNLVVYYDDEVVWKSLHDEDTWDEDDYYTILQGDANLITRQGTPENPGDRVWKSNSPSSTTDVYFFGLACDEETVGIYRGIPTNPRAPVWEDKN